MVFLLNSWLSRSPACFPSLGCICCLGERFMSWFTGAQREKGQNVQEEQAGTETPAKPLLCIRAGPLRRRGRLPRGSGSVHASSLLLLRRGNEGSPLHIPQDGKISGQRPDFGLPAPAESVPLLNSSSLNDQKHTRLRSRTTDWMINQI